MMPFTDATGLLGEAIAIAAIASRVPGMSRLAPGVRRAVAAGALALALALVPLGGLPLAAYMRGAVGDLSITSLLLLVLSLGRFTRGGALAQAASSGREILLALVAATSVVFYPLALGWGNFDPYRLGYASEMLLACLLAIALWAASQRRTMVAAALALAVAAWSAGWYASGNLWDYLMDPLVAVYALGALARQGLRKLVGRWRLQ